MTEEKMPFVLLIDDNDTDNLIGKRMIEITGFSDNVMVMSSAKKALGYLEDNQFTHDELPDIIFLDINMPIIDGFEFLEEFDLLSNLLKEKCKIVVLTSSDSDKDIKRVENNAHVIKYITKPLKQEELEAIKRLLMTA